MYIVLQADDGIRDGHVTGVQTCALPISDRDPQVRTVHGTVKADRVVLATGIPIADRGGFFARVVPERSYLVAVYDPEAEIGRASCRESVASTEGKQASEQ